MMRRCSISLAAALAACFFCHNASGQFNQGPPGNPSGAGIIVGTQPPAPLPPRPVGPPPSGPLLPFGGAGGSSGCPLGAGLVMSPGLLLSSDGMPTGAEGYLTAGFGRGLDLSEEQAARIRGIRDRFYRETRDLRYDLAQKRLQLRKLLADPKVDRQALLAGQKELSSLWLRLSDAMARAIVDERDVLTPAQIEKLDQVSR